jgi:hypothetical protein
MAFGIKLRSDKSILDELPKHICSGYSLRMHCLQYLLEIYDSKKVSV